MKKINITPESVLEYISSQLLSYTKNGVPGKLTVDTNPSVKLSEEEKVTITFSPLAEEKMQALIETAKTEVGWNGIVERISEKDFYIKDILMFPQEVTGSTVETDDTEFTNWLTEQVMNDTINSIRFHGHSHVYMGVTPSVTDTTYQNQILKDIKDFYIFGIFNKKGDFWLNIFDVQNNNLYEKDDIDYYYERTEAKKWAEESIEKYVKEKSHYPTYREYYSKNYTGNKYNTPNKKDEKDNSKDKYSSGDVFVRCSYYDPVLNRMVWKGESVQDIALERKLILEEGEKYGEK